jgi:hypothetical protein
MAQRYHVIILQEFTSTSSLNHVFHDLDVCFNELKKVSVCFLLFMHHVTVKDKDIKYVYEV